MASRVARTIPILIAVCAVSFPAYGKYSGGTGEPNDPYRIATAPDLIALGETPEDYDKQFILTTDIDLDPNLPGRKVFDKAVIAPDTDDTEGSFQGTPFTGVFDGNSHDISHMTIKGEGYLGLFGQLGSRATVQNLGLDAAHVSGTGDCVGGLVGRNDGSVTNCYSIATVTGNQNVGGLVGTNNANIVTSYGSGTVTGRGWPDTSVGGLAGVNTGRAVIAGSYSTGAVGGNGNVGGLVGYNSGKVTQCYSAGTAMGHMDVGGLVGSSWGSISVSYSTGKVRGGPDAGGLVGSANRLNIISSFWDMETSERTTSDGGTGLTTTEMQDINTYVNAGWDFVDEILNGTSDYWQISAGDYPRLHYHFAESPVMPEGSGTPRQPYLIRDARDLGTVWFKPLAYYHLEASLDLSGITWSEAVVPWFGGTFVGNGCVISNLHIEGGGHLGLFGQLESASDVRGLGVVDVNITGSGYDVGGLAGSNNGSISMSYSAGAVSGYGHVGGLAGGNFEGTITASHSTSTVKGHGGSFGGPVGGLTGENSGRINRSYSTGTVSGGDHYDVGGLVGRNSGAVIDCNSTCSVTGDYLVGGLVGDNNGAVFTCNSACSVTGSHYVGGLVGRNVGNMVNCCSTGDVVGNEAIGGLVGINGYCLGAMPYPGYIDKSYSLASARGDIFVGGLVGDNWAGDVTQCYSKGAVNGGSNVGGLVGIFSANTVSQCYSTSALSGDGENVGGLIGDGWSPGIAASFWDTQTSGQSASFGGIGKTTVEMQTADTFLEAGWDFSHETANGTADIWSILEGQGYPRLYWELIEDGPGQLPSVVGKASGPYPADGALGVEEPWSTRLFELAWIAGLGAVAHNVYLGTDLDMVSRSNIDSIPGALILQNLAVPELRLWILERDRTYYWRIDEVGKDGTIVTGEVWSFTTALRPSFWKGRACFTGDTPVWIDGNLIPISNTVPGQVVRCGDDQDKVEEVQVHNGTFTCYDIVLATGNSITVAECHYFMTDSEQWLALHDLKTGTRLKTLKGDVGVTSIRKRPIPYAGKVFNLKMKGSDRYLVGKDAVVVRDY